MSEHAAQLDAAGLVVLHASAVRVDGRALLFLGPSGAGKSTICRLLRDFAAPLADDAAYAVYRQGLGWVVENVSSPTFEQALRQGRLDELLGTPLGAVFRLFQAAHPRLEVLPPWQTCRYLAEAVAWQAQPDVEARRSLWARLADLARSTPGYGLYFDLSPTTARLIREMTQ